MKAFGLGSNSSSLYLLTGMGPSEPWKSSPAKSRSVSDLRKCSSTSVYPHPLLPSDSHSSKSSGIPLNHTWPFMALDPPVTFPLGKRKVSFLSGRALASYPQVWAYGSKDSYQALTPYLIWSGRCLLFG